MDERWNNQAEYHDDCWVDRFKEGHNSGSHAMHYGIYPDDDQDHQHAKRQTNDLVAAHIDWDTNHQTFLDIGCGVGGTAIHLGKVARDAGIHPDHWQLVGIAGSQQQLILATELATQEGVQDHVEFFAMDFHNLVLNDDEDTDLVYAIESMCQSWDKGQVLREIKRVLRPGGTFVHIDGCLTVGVKETETWKDCQHLVDAVCKGFALTDLYDIPLDSHLVETWTDEDIGDISTQDLTDLVMPGIARSAEKARPMIDDTEPGSRWRDHLLACIAIFQLFDRGIMKYKMTTVDKR